MGRDMAADRAPSADASSVGISGSPPMIEVLLVVKRLHSAALLITTSSRIWAASVVPATARLRPCRRPSRRRYPPRRHGAIYAPHARAPRGEGRGWSQLQPCQPSSGSRVLQLEIDKSLTYRDRCRATGAEYVASTGSFAMNGMRIGTCTIIPASILAGGTRIRTPSPCHGT